MNIGHKFLTEVLGQFNKMENKRVKIDNLKIGVDKLKMNENANTSTAAVNLADADGLVTRREFVEFRDEVRRELEAQQKRQEAVDKKIKDLIVTEFIAQWDKLPIFNIPNGPKIKMGGKKAEEQGANIL